MKLLIVIFALCLGFGSAYLFKTQAETPLEKFTILTAEDPLFYSPVMQDDFSKSIEALMDSENKLIETAIENLLKKDASYTETYVSLLENYPIFPTDFLASLPLISEKTDEFLSNPSMAKANQLLALYEESATHYFGYASSTVAIFNSIDTYLPADRPHLYFFTDSATTKNIVQSDTELLLKNAQTLLEEIDRRKNCLENGKTCTVQNENIRYKLPLQKAPLSNPDTDLVTKLITDSDNYSVNGPYVIHSECWPGTDNEHQMYALYSKTDPSFLLPKIATTNYYRVVDDTTNDLIGKALADRDTSFYYQPEATTYECSDLTFYVDILTLDYLTSSTTLPSNKKAELIENPFGILAPAFFSLATFTDVLTESQKIISDFTISPQFLFTTRSAYSLTYLPFSKSIWRISDFPNYQLSRVQYENLSVNTPFVTLQYLLQNDTSIEEIKSAQIDQRKIIKSLQEN